MNFSQSAIFSVIASVGLLLINLFVNVIQARLLGPAEIGRFQIYITTQTYISTILALGIGQSCIYFINALKINERRVLSSSINSTLLLAVISGLGIFLLISLNKKYFGNDSPIGVCLFSIGTSAMLISNVFTPVLLSKMEVVKNQIVKYSTSILTLVVLLFVIAHGAHLDVSFLIGLIGCTNILSVLLLYYYFINRFSFRDKIDFYLLKEIVFYGVKLSGNNIASITLLSLPIYFLSWFSTTDSASNVGYYGRANSLLVIGTVIASSIGPLLYSKWSGITRDNLKQQVRNFSLLFTILNVLVSILIVLTAPILIKVIYGADFLTSIPVLQILSISIIANGFREICYGIFSSQGYPTKILKNLIIGIVISIIANYCIIPKFGVIGCACVTSFVSIITAWMLMIDVMKISSIDYKDFFYLPSLSNIKDVIKSVFNKSIV